MPVTSLGAVAARLKAIREATHPRVSQKHFAEEIVGIPYTSWNMYELGNQMIPALNALKVRAATGISLDYIFAGDRSKLPADLAPKLGEYGARRTGTEV